jgi:hypothetical protein
VPRRLGPLVATLLQLVPFQVQVSPNAEPPKSVTTAAQLCAEHVAGSVHAMHAAPPVPHAPLAVPA